MFHANQTEIKEKTEAAKQIVVVGMGPAGLAFIAALIYNYKKADAQTRKHLQFSVIPIEFRDHFTDRQQRLVDIKSNHSEENFDYTWEMFLDELDALQHFSQPNLFGTSSNFFSETQEQAKKIVNKLSKLAQKFHQQGSEQRQGYSAEFKNFSIRELQKALIDFIDANQGDGISVSWHHNATIQNIDLVNGSVTTKSN